MWAQALHCLAAISLCLLQNSAANAALLLLLSLPPLLPSSCCWCAAAAPFRSWLQFSYDMTMWWLEVGSVKRGGHSRCPYQPAVLWLQLLRSHVVAASLRVSTVLGNAHLQPIEPTARGCSGVHCRLQLYPVTATVDVAVIDVIVTCDYDLDLLPQKPSVCS
jgi:hypothetical protein